MFKNVKNYKWKTLLPVFTSLVLIGCDYSGTPVRNSKVNETFRNYWYTGQADVISYDLHQSRYGEPREGHAVLIFVTEPFSVSGQVKLDDPENASDKVSVMKMNFTKKFITGIYPYSIMLSTFTAVNTSELTYPLKLIMSSQEWCGQLFTQMNLRNNMYMTQQYSYFESEGDQKSQLGEQLSEDAIWSQIRLNPDLLPVGSLSIIPGLFDVRLRHQPLEPQQAVGAKSDQGDRLVYSIKYKNGRTFQWTYEKAFPHQIVEWIEKFHDTEGKEYVTTGKFKKLLHIPYWKYNHIKDGYLRDSLGLN